MVEPRAAAFHNPPQSAATGDGGEIQIGSICLQVVSGDLTRETTEAIVNGTNSELDIKQGKCHCLRNMSFFIIRNLLFVSLKCS